MSSRKVALALAFTVGLGCSRSRDDAGQSGHNATPIVSAANPATAAPPSPAEPAVEKPRRTVSAALFRDTTLLVCTDFLSSASDEEIAKVIESNAATRLNQSCASLGRTELTSCTSASMVQRYYNAKFSDKFMASCVKAGGQWATNRSPLADVERAQQELDALQNGHAVQP